MWRLTGRDSENDMRASGRGSPVVVLSLLIFMALLLGGCSFRSYESGGARAATYRTVSSLKNSPREPVYPARKPDYGAAQSRARARAGAVYRVQAGQTLYGLSRKFGIPVRTLIVRNRLKAPYLLNVGQNLSLPAPSVHMVRRGETGYGISRRYGITVSSLMRENNIKYPYRLSVGQKLTLPGGAVPDTAEVEYPAPTEKSATAAYSPKVQSPQNKQKTRLPPPPPRTDSRFSWPVDGRLVSRFGPKEGGQHNDGINILASGGTSVKASEAGVVAYASNALEGYGNLLLIKHAGGWVTAYAHNERLLVGEGEKVSRGQVIARVGRSGGVTEPQLHFEIRKGRRALDPLGYLETRAASR